jgi:hypothetical protein
LVAEEILKKMKLLKNISLFKLIIIDCDYVCSAFLGENFGDNHAGRAGTCE